MTPQFLGIFLVDLVFFCFLFCLVGFFLVFCWCCWYFFGLFGLASFFSPWSWA